MPIFSRHLGRRLIDRCRRILLAPTRTEDQWDERCNTKSSHNSKLPRLFPEAQIAVLGAAAVFAGQLMAPRFRLFDGRLYCSKGAVREMPKRFLLRPVIDPLHHTYCRITHGDTLHHERASPRTTTLYNHELARQALHINAKPGLTRDLSHRVPTGRQAQPRCRRSLDMVS
jgi:hypothetical protein